jgi:hypothetical protein
MPGRLDRVLVETSLGMVTLSWDTRDRLLAELRHLDSLEPVTDDFENACASRPVVIPQELKPAVVQVIEMIGKDSTEGLAGLEGGLVELRDALVDEMMS